MKIRGLRVSFPGPAGPRAAVNGADLTIDRAEIVGLVGESGSGKSVTALSILRLLPRARIDAGSIVWRGGEAPVDLATLPLHRMGPYRGGEIAVIFQDPMSSLNPVFRCGWQIEEAIRTHGDVGRGAAAYRTAQLLEEVGIRDPDRVARSYPHQLSGGMRQRVMIAMALACDPKLLLADEPTTALDVTTQRQVLDLLSRLRDDRGLAILFISHDLGVVAEIADRVAILMPGDSGGSVVETGAVGKVFRDPGHSYTRGLIACRPPIDRRLFRLPTMDQERGGEPRAARTRPAAEPGPPALELARVHTFFAQGAVRAVDGVDLTIPPGATLGLVGESGCGKSTLGRTVLGLESPEPGSSIRFHGREVSAMGRRERTRRMQIVFQDPYSSLNPKKDVRSTLTEPMAIHGLHGSGPGRRDRAVFLLERVGLSSDSLPRRPREFSGGQRQRIAIARALAVEPEFLVLDECVSSLDVSVQAEVLNLLRDLQDQFGLTYLFISHDLSVVRQMADEVAVMATDAILSEFSEGEERERLVARARGGHIVESRAADGLFRAPEHPYTRGLLAAVPGAQPPG